MEDSAAPWRVAVPGGLSRSGRQRDAIGAVAVALLTRRRTHLARQSLPRAEPARTTTTTTTTTTSSSSSSSSTDSGDDGIIEGTVVAASTLRVGGQSEQLCVFASTSKREGQQEKKVF